MTRERKPSPGDRAESGGGTSRDGPALHRFGIVAVAFVVSRFTSAGKDTSGRGPVPVGVFEGPLVGPTALPLLHGDMPPPLCPVFTTRREDRRLFAETLPGLCPESALVGQNAIREDDRQRLLKGKLC